MKRMIWLQYVLLTLSLLLTGCNRPQVEAVLSPATPTLPVMETTVLVNTLPPEPPTPFPTNPLPAEIPVIDTSGWGDYANDAYGFSFRYPADWTVELDQRSDSNMAQHLLWLRPQQAPNVEMTIAFKRSEEPIHILPMGMGGGELVDRGSILFIGQEAAMRALVANGLDMSIFYYSGGVVERGGVQFAIGLRYAGSPLDASTLSPEMEAIADQIVSSFQLNPSA